MSTLLTTMTPIRWLPTLVVTAVVLVVLFLYLRWMVRMGIIIHHKAHKAQTWRQRVQAHFSGLSPTPWFFAWCKTRLDPMFTELPEFFQTYHASPPAVVLDIGCGYGITGCAMLEWFPAVKVYGLDPAKVRAIAAQRVFGDRGLAVRSGAPQIIMFDWPVSYDTILALDMIHFLSDDELDLTFQRIAKMLLPGGRLYLRTIITQGDKKSWLWHYETVRRKLLRIPTYYRTIEQVTAHMNSAGLRLLRQGPSGTDTELDWFIAERTDTPAALSQ